MCIKLTYLRSLVKSAARVFCFGKKQPKFDSNVDESQYFKNELSEKILIDVTDQPVQLTFNTWDIKPYLKPAALPEDEVKAKVKQIVSDAEIDIKFAETALDLWKSLPQMRSFQTHTTDNQALACVHATAVDSSLGIAIIIKILEKLDVPKNSSYSAKKTRECVRLVRNWTEARREVLRLCINFPKEVEDVALNIVRRVIGDATNQFAIDAEMLSTAASFLSQDVDYEMNLEDFTTDSWLKERIIRNIDGILAAGYFTYCQFE